MAYDPRAEKLMLLRRCVTGLFDFTGRSRRTELVVFLVAMTVIQFVIALVWIIFSLPFSISGNLDYYTKTAFWILAIPIFVRRLHDQNRTGWLAVIMPILAGLDFYAHYQFEVGNLLVPKLGYPYNVLQSILGLVFLLLLFWPGTKGDNRFAPDPRELDVPSVR